MVLTQVALYAKAPPTTGPDTDPRAHTPPMAPKYAPRSLMGTKSVMMISLSSITPPPPMPWTVLPASITVKFCATPEMIMPIKKQMMQNVSAGIRPKMCDKAAIGG